MNPGITLPSPLGPSRAADGSPSTLPEAPQAGSTATSPPPRTLLAMPADAYPQRDDSRPPGPWSRLRTACRGPLARLRPLPTAGFAPAVRRGLRESVWSRMDDIDLAIALAPDRGDALPPLRERLRAEQRAGGLNGEATGEALAMVARVVRRDLQLKPYKAQLAAAAAMLDGRLAEMATGEGKTLAMGLAAAVAALAGVPVHVLTANDYLVQRDREQLLPVYDALGLSSACVLSHHDRETRTAAYRHDIVYLCARELAFDYLRDHLALHGERDPRAHRAQALHAGPQDGTSAPAPAEPVLPGLHLALVDEADSILLDEATVPLVLSSAAAPPDEAALRRALELSDGLVAGEHYRLHPGQHRAALTEAGRERVRVAVLGAAGWLRPARRAWELVQAALVARHALTRGRDYVVHDGRLQLIDELTGRIATGRQWSDPLQALVELKEGLPASAPLRTAAQITYQRFFPRYLVLGGMSGTLSESRGELAALYGVPLCRVPLSRTDRRRWLGERLLADAASRDAEVIEAVLRETRRGRPVLVGTGSVEASERLSTRLRGAGIEHQLLNATQDADEAARIAQAGQAGCVTVATNIAGRGTDIRLCDAAREAGGLHVIATMLNRSGRIDRQLVGRAARHGDPGSAERLLALDDPLLRQHAPPWLHAAAVLRAGADGVPAWLARPLVRIAQQRAQSADAAVRRALRRADRQAREFYGFAGAIE